MYYRDVILTRHQNSKEAKPTKSSYNKCRFELQIDKLDDKRCLLLDLYFEDLTWFNIPMSDIALMARLEPHQLLAGKSENQSLS